MKVNRGSFKETVVPREKIRDLSVLSENVNNEDFRWSPPHSPLKQFSGKISEYFAGTSNLQQKILINKTYRYKLFEAKKLSICCFCLQVHE